MIFLRLAGIYCKKLAVTFTLLDVEIELDKVFAFTLFRQIMMLKTHFE